jgi:hypothetical protein
MSKKERKVFKEKLIAAVKKILKANNTQLTAKIEKVVKKSVRQIVKKSQNKLTPLKSAVAAVK